MPLLRSFKEISLSRPRRPKAAGSNQSPVSPQHLRLGQRFHRRRLFPASFPSQVPRCRHGKEAPCPGHTAPAPALRGATRGTCSCCPRGISGICSGAAERWEAAGKAQTPSSQQQLAVALKPQELFFRFSVPNCKCIFLLQLFYQQFNLCGL